MGKPGSQPQIDQSPVVAGTAQSSTSINHFSHPHPLHLCNIQSQQGFNTNPCSGCKHVVSGTIYTCTMCNYSLHEKCSQMPQKITHPFDTNNHVLSLLTKPAYSEGVFSCDACGEQGNGFSYHCETCGIDLHILCASLPMVKSHQSHHHQLNLIFAPPYPVGTFNCDICRRGGSKKWLYRCNNCEFDVHLNCMNTLPSNLPHQPSLMNQFHSLMGRSSSLPPQQTNPVGYNSFRPTGIALPFQPQPLHHSVSSGALANPYAVPTPMQNSMPQNHFMHSGSYGAPVMPSGYGQQNTLTGQIAGGVANGIASGASQAVAQALIQGMFGNGGGGGNGGVVQADQGSYLASDGSFIQMDGGYGGDATTTY